MRSLRGRTTVIGPSKEHPVPIALDAAAWKGALAFGEDGVMYWSTGLTWTATGAQTAEGLAPIARVDDPILKTVGPGGDFATLGAALAFFSGLMPSATNTEKLGTVKILSGVTLAEQITLFGVDLSWVQITSEDAFVDVNVAAFTTSAPTTSTIFHFMFFGNSYAPAIFTKFRQVNTLPQAGRSIGLFLRAAEYLAVLDSTVWPNAEDDGVPATDTVYKAGLHHFDENVRVGSEATAELSTMEFVASSNTKECVRISSGSATLVGTRIRRTAGTAKGVVVQASGQLTTVFSDLQLTAGSDSDDDIVMRLGAKVYIGETVKGGIDQPNLSPDLDGLLIDARNTNPPEWKGVILPEPYTLATLPPAADYPNALVLTTDDKRLRISDGAQWIVAGGTDSGGLAFDAFGPFSGRSTHDAEAADFAYLSTNGAAGAGAPAVLYIKNSATSADWSAAIPLGLAGPKGDKGDPGDAGQIGPTGPSGSDGDSAYEIAVTNGFSGTEAEWLESLIGPEGAGIKPAGTLASVNDLPAQGTLGQAFVIDGDLHVWTVSQEWENIGPFAGPAGAAGEDGADGAPGLGLTAEPVQTASFTAVAGRAYPCNTAGGAFPGTLPLDPAPGARLVFSDPTASWAANNFTVARNGEPILGLAEDLICDVAGLELTFEYVDATRGWTVFYKGGLTP